MKLLHVSCLLSLVLLVTAGCVTQEKYGEFSPKGELKPSMGTAYADYGPAMAHADGYQMAYEWQRGNPEAVAEATTHEALFPFVKDEASAEALLARIGTSYDGDPLVLTQVAAVTQLVMSPKCRKCPRAGKCRTVWVAALERTRAKTDDGYVRTFCDQQLRLCK